MIKLQNLAQITFVGTNISNMHKLQNLAQITQLGTNYKNLNKLHNWAQIFEMGKNSNFDTNFPGTTANPPTLLPAKCWRKQKVSVPAGRARFASQSRRRRLKLLALQ